MRRKIIFLFEVYLNIVAFNGLFGYDWIKAKREDMGKEFIVYRGSEFTIEWCYNDRGKSSSKIYFDDLDRERKLEAFELFMTMAKIGKIFNITKFRSEGDGIYAFKPKPDRFLCFFYSGKKIIITNAFEKKQDKLSPAEKKKALNCQKDYKTRVEEGVYYE